MAVNDGSGIGWPFVNFGMEMRGTQTERGPSRISMVYPRRKFTFLVEFFINPRVWDNGRVQTNIQTFIQNGRLLTTLKSIDHPKLSFENEKIRSYNKWVIVPTKVDYPSASMTFHDDNTSISSALIREYRSYYQHAGTMGTTAVVNGSLNNTNIEEFRYSSILLGEDVRSEMNIRPSMGMRLRPNNGRHFFDLIRLYDLGSDPDSVNVYTYLYPVITTVDHDPLDYEDRTGHLGINISFDYEDYYHMVGLNNSEFHDIIEQHLGFRPSSVSPNVNGHARMLSENSTEEGEDTGYPVNSSLNENIPAPSPDVFFPQSDVVSLADALTVSPITETPLIGSAPITDIEDAINNAQ